MSRESDAARTLRVRPYMVTGGRTRATADIALETMIHTSEDPVDRRLSTEEKKITKLCAEPLSVAEISAHMKLPLQVVKVLLSDLIDDGSVVTHAGVTDSGDRPDLALLERVLDGLQSL